MKRVLFFLLVIAICLTPALAPPAFANSVEDNLFPVELRNRTTGQVIIVLRGLDGSGVYHLSVAPGTDQHFGVLGGSYAHTTYACGNTGSGTLQVTRQLRLVFTPCPEPSPNQGAPSMEKIHLSDSPRGIWWDFHYGLARTGGILAGSGVSAGACDYTATAQVDIYFRPHPSADIFSTQGAGFSIQPTARTSNGWLGFDPGVAQAANIGSFRLRWLPPGSGSVSGGCSSLPVVWGPLPGICYDMPMGDTNVYSTPDSSAAVLIVLHLGEFAELLGTTASGDWARVDLGPGNTGSHAVGWVEASSLNVNGPCGSLPTVSP